MVRGWRVPASARPARRPARPVVPVLAVLCAIVLAGCSAPGSAPEAKGATPAPTLTPAPTKAPPAFGRYVALGDSFTAAPFVPVTDVANGCFRSSANYPALVASTLGAELDDRSCGGAVTANFTASQFPGVAPQFSALDASTDLVTVSIGGNENTLFRRLTGKCPALRAKDPNGAPCEAFMTRGGRDALVSSIVKARPAIVAAVKEISRLAPNAKVLVVGYPQIVSADNRCAELPLATGDYAYAVRVNRALTETMAKAARATGSTYIDIWKASQGHDICSADPWVNGSVNDQKRAARYHPFAAEQQAVATLIEAALAGS